MKKACFLGITVLLALVMFSCDGLTTPAEVVDEVTNVVGYTADGRALVELSIGVDEGSERALTSDLAQGGVNFYEVVFATPLSNTGTVDAANTEVYRASWSKGKSAKIAVPSAEYDFAATNGAAFMFAGRVNADSTRTLMAIGKLTNVSHKETNYPGSASVVVTADSNAVQFTLTSLTTDIKNELASSFKVWAVDAVAMPNDVIATTTEYKDAAVPTFQLEPSRTGGTAYQAYFGITMGSGTGGATGDEIEKILLLAPSTGNTDLASGGITFGSDVTLGTGAIASLTGTKFTGALAQHASNALAFTGAYYTAPASNSVTLNLPITITTGANTGFSMMSISVPVQLLSIKAAANSVAAQVWQLRGGINNADPDGGASANGGSGSLGGAVLIEVIDKSSFGLRLDVEHE